jgi:transposase
VAVETASQDALEIALRRVAELEAALSSTTKTLASVTAEHDKTTKTLASVTAERDKLRRAYEQLKEQHELLRRRIFLAKAERIDTRQLELEFAETKVMLEKLAKELGDPSLALSDDDGDDGDEDGSGDGARRPRKRKGRRDLRALHMPEERVELLDPELEGKAPRIGFEESCLLGYRRGGPVRIVVARAKYKVGDDDAEICTAPKPKEVYERGLLAPSFMAHLLVKKFRWGMPFHRFARELASEGIPLSDSTMGRYAEHVGATLGCIVDACAADAKANAFCLSTDATGVSIQPERIEGGPRQACAKGHFFVVLADKDHVFFEFQKKHTSDAVCSMFKGFSGYIQADAHCVYDALFRGDACASPDEKPPDEIGCWSHARRKFWEAAVTTKEPVAREALLYVRQMFQLEERWAGLAPKQRHDKRQLAMNPLLTTFFAWAEAVFERVRGVRGPVASAFGYVVRQKNALSRFLADGRLRLENNASERALRAVAVGRKAWLFFGSDDHAHAAANLLSLIASCQLHDLDAEAYLADVIRVLPYWPSDRYLELAPKHWVATRARLRKDELELAGGHVTVPPPPTAEQQTSPR